MAQCVFLRHVLRCASDYDGELGLVVAGGVGEGACGNYGGGGVGRGEGCWGFSGGMLDKNPSRYVLGD